MQRSGNPRPKITEQWPGIQVLTALNALSARRAILAAIRGLVDTQNKTWAKCRQDGPSVPGVTGGGTGLRMPDTRKDEAGEAEDAESEPRGARKPARATAYRSASAAHSASTRRLAGDTGVSARTAIQHHRRACALLPASNRR